MPSFMRRFKHSQNLDIKDIPSLMHSPSTISSTSQSSISISLRRRMTTLLPCYIFTGVAPPPRPFPTSPESHGPTLLAARHRPHLQIPVDLRRRASIISKLDMACTDSPVSPSFPRMSEILQSVPTYVIPPGARAAAQLALYRTLELSVDDADACVAWLAGTPHLAALVTMLTLCAYPPAHGPSFVLALALALGSMRALSALTLPAFDAELLAAAPGTLTHLTLLADTLPYAFFDGFLVAPARARLTHLALPHFVGVPPAAQDVLSAAVPRLAVLDSSPGLAAALAPGPRCTTAFALRPSLALGGALKELGLVLAPDVDVRTRGRLLGALGNTGAGLEVLELSLDGTSDEVLLQALYKQVGSLLPNVQALRTLRLRTSLPTEAAKAEEGSSRLALWIYQPLGSASRRVVFPSGAQ
ncbi:hypothetical protein EDB83DRAFT_2315391 [Lactarius deliciosus]|nr:hypothetical protein EDB83DRAFT_2315391 [Lactarius deliciosus]